MYTTNKYEAVLSMRIESEDPTDPEAIVQDLLEDIAPKGPPID